MKIKRLSHVDAKGAVRMVDVSAKQATVREAVAEAVVVMQPATLRQVKRNAMAKGNVLLTARLAGIAAAKLTPQLIPLCHAIRLGSVQVECKPEGASKIRIRATARATDVTGVEMEALTAASVAALTVYDMCKAVEKGIEITSVRLLKKSGGKSGDYKRGKNSGRRVSS